MTKHKDGRRRSVKVICLLCDRTFTGSFMGETGGWWFLTSAKGLCPTHADADLRRLPKPKARP